MPTRPSLAAMLLAAAASMAVGCGGSASMVSHSPGPPPLDGGATEVRVVPEVASSVDGVYRLQEIDGAALPSAFVADSGCTARITAGSLTLSRRHFTFSLSTERRCGATARTDARTASGEWSADVATLRLRPDTGNAFTAARAVFINPREVRMEAVTSGVERAVNWRFVRVGPLNAAHYGRTNRVAIQSPTAVSATGEKVSSI